MERLNRILNVLNRENVEYDDSFPIELAQILERNPTISEEEFVKQAGRIRTNLFRRYKLSKQSFLRSVHKEAGGALSVSSPFEISKHFVENFLKLGLSPKNDEVRQQILASFKTKAPHGKLLTALGQLLQRITTSHQLSLHGTKEYSGIDLAKTVAGTEIGFQLKSQYDDVSEKSIRYQHSKAREWQLDGYVLIFARKPESKVSEAIQVAHHFFTNENERGEMFCALLTPEQLAELFVIYQIRV